MRACVPSNGGCSGGEEAAEAQQYVVRELLMESR